MAPGLRAHHGALQSQGKEVGSLKSIAGSAGRELKEEGRIQTGIRVLGTAGHVDHGKSTLIEALTGTHPDRLKEEQAREMTIDLGFGWLTLPDGREVGIVDVPGHRDFVENMLAGVAGIDAVLLVVALDEGVMPQTVEHLAIIDLLHIPGGVIVLTKADLVKDGEWLRAVEDDVRAVVRGTALEHAAMVRVSARSRVGLRELISAISAQLTLQPPRPNLGKPRLALDRVFTMEGFGTVVTGTLIDGEFAVGDEIQVLPQDLRGRIRGLQNHSRQIQVAYPGSRTAANISGIAAEQLQRGAVIVRPGQYESTRRIDARFRLLRDSSASMLHNRSVKAFLGTSETMATLRLLGTDELKPGEEAWIQLELQHPLVCARGDAFVLRRPSPPETLGGGTVIEPHPAGRHKRFANEVLNSLRTLSQGEASEVLYAACGDLGPTPVHEILARSRLAPEAAGTALHQLLEEGRLIALEGGKPSAASEQLVISRDALTQINARIGQIVGAFHTKFPLRGGIPREELKSQLGISTVAFNAIVNRGLASERIVQSKHLVALRGHEILFGAGEQAAIEKLMRRFDASPYAPPTIKECKQVVGDEVFGALKELSRVVIVSEEVLFRKGDYEHMVAAIRDALQKQGSITLAEVRDLFHTSRKYAQALLEHLDTVGMTRRQGDARWLAE